MQNAAVITVLVLYCTVIQRSTFVQKIHGYDYANGESRWFYKNTRNRLQTEHKLSLLITFNNNNNNNNVKMFSVNVFLTRWSLRPKRWGQNWQRKSLLPVWTTRCLRTSLRVKKRRSQWSHRNLRSAGLFTVLDPVCTWIHKLQNYMLITFSALLIYILQQPITWPSLTPHRKLTTVDSVPLRQLNAD